MGPPILAAAGFQPALGVKNSHEGRRSRLERRLRAGLPAPQIAALLLAIFAAHAQNAPHVAYALPAGGRQGATVQVTLGGQYLATAAAVSVSGSGVQGVVTGSGRPMNGNQATELRDRMQELQKKPQPVDAAVLKEMIDIRGKLLLFQHTRLLSPVLAETLSLKVTIAPDAAPGRRELRLAAPQGLSNPLIFWVGQLPEFIETEKVEVIAPPAAAAGAPAMQTVNQVRISEPPTDMPITLPAVVNGRIKPRIGTPQQQGRPVQPFTPGESDRYRFEARRGQQLVIAASARELMPYLADAVPGWFQAVLTLYGAAGKEVAYDDDFRFHPDPVIHYVVPQDGEYALEIKDALYRGREDFVYRITIGELPYVTGIFPLGGRAGANTSVALTGWNLPSNRLAVNGKGEDAGIREITASALPFQWDTLPETLEKENHSSPGSAQRVKLPIMVNGRIDRPDDWDVFRFDGRKGQEMVAEVYARRLDSPLDSVLKLTDAKGKQLAFNDDFDDAGAGLETHHADSRIMTTLPANGTYYLWLGDAQHKGGPEYAYRLRIGAPRPDFELRVTPSAINAGVGMNNPITVHALRRDGFSGEIQLSVRNAPKGVELAGASIPAGSDQVRVTLTVPALPVGRSFGVKLEGRASIEGRTVVHAAVPAEDMMQAFFYRHLVAATDAAELKIAIRGGGVRSPVKVVAGAPLRIPAGGTARIETLLTLPPNSPIAAVHYELSEPPAGIEMKDVPPGRSGSEIVLQCDASKAKPGLKGNLIITMSGERTVPAANGRPQANRQRVALGTLPAVPFEIVEP